MFDRLILFKSMACCLLTVTGCGKSVATFPVEGRVVFYDGIPVADGTIEFETMGGRKPITATSQIGCDGRFCLGIDAPGDGVLPGTHRVAVIAHYEIGTEMERPKLLPQGTKDSKYRSFKTSDLTFVVEPNTNLFEVIVGRQAANPEAIDLQS